MSFIYDNFIVIRIIIVQAPKSSTVKELSALMEMHLFSPMWSHM